MKTRSAAVGGFLSVLLLFTLGTGPAYAGPLLCFGFTQTGYSSGATVTGSFCGADLNNDGWLADFSSPNTGEITSYSMSFSGNGNVPAFTQTLTDLAMASPMSTNGLVYRLGTPFLGDDAVSPFEGLASGPVGGLSIPGFTFAYRTGYGPTGIATAFGFVEQVFTTPGGQAVTMIDQTQNYVVVTSVPEPATMALLAVGVTAAGVTTRRRRRRAGHAMPGKWSGRRRLASSVAERLCPIGERRQNIR